MTETDTSLRGEKLWGAQAMAQFTGLSTDTIYRLADDPDVPIYRPPGAGMLFGIKSELVAWLRTKPKMPEKT